MREIERYNDQLAELYDEATTGYFQWKAPARAWQAIQDRVRPGCQVLDLGVGTGQSARPFLEGGCEVVGADISSEMLGITRSHLPDVETHKLDLDEGLGPLADRRFDIVIAVGLVEWLQSLELFLKMTAPVLRRDGLLCFTYEMFIPDSRLQKWRCAELGRGVTQDSGELNFLVRRYTKEDVLTELTKLGLRATKHEEFDAYLKRFSGGKEEEFVTYGLVVAEFD